jgi:RHS repeat protein
MTPDKEVRRREQHRRARELRQLAVQFLRELFSWLVRRKQGLVADEDWPFDRPEPDPEGRRYTWTYDTQGRLTSMAQY